MPNLLNALRAGSFKIRFYQIANAILTKAAGRWLGIVHVVEYPKCGASWIRLMMQDYVGGKPYFDDRIISPGTLVQLHSLPSAWHCKPIVVVRDPRDMFVSFYYFETTYDGRREQLAVNRFYTRDSERDVRDDFAAYLKAKLENRTYPPFSYHEFVDSWIERPGVCLVRYEDMLAETVTQMGRVIEFAGLSMDRDRLGKIINYHHFTSATKRAEGVGRMPGEADANKFLRKGIAGDWRNHFNETSCKLIENHEGATLRRLGYERDAAWIDDFLGASPSLSKTSN